MLGCRLTVRTSQLYVHLRLLVARAPLLLMRSMRDSVQSAALFCFSFVEFEISCGRLHSGQGAVRVTLLGPTSWTASLIAVLLRGWRAVWNAFRRSLLHKAKSRMSGQEIGPEPGLGSDDSLLQTATSLLSEQELGPEK